MAERVYLFLGMLFGIGRANASSWSVTAGRFVSSDICSSDGVIDEFLERWDSEPVDNCAVTAYTHDYESERLTLRSLNVVHWPPLS